MANRPIGEGNRYNRPVRQFDGGPYNAADLTIAFLFNETKARDAAGPKYRWLGLPCEAEVGDGDQRERRDRQQLATHGPRSRSMIHAASMMKILNAINWPTAHPLAGNDGRQVLQQSPGLAAPPDPAIAIPMLPPAIVSLPYALGPWLDLAGLAVFAASGALAAVRRGQTIVTSAFFALITGVGGGTVRDLLIGAPVFWLHDSRAAAVCLSMAFLVWITPERWWREAALDWLDAVGLAAYAVFGAAKALSYGIPVVPAALMGVMTACVGGIIRDVLAGVPSIIMRPEIYVTAAALASSLFVALVALHLPAALAAVAAAAAGFSLRAAAIHFRLALPAYRRKR